MCLCVCILMSLAISVTRATGIFPCRTGANNYNEYKCQNGTSCIHMEQICNGIWDCPDGADEMFCPYERNDFQSDKRLNRRKRESPCNYGYWHCGQGHCISQEKLCDGTADCNDSSDEASTSCNSTSTSKSAACIIPPYPEHGTYEVAHIPNVRPGQSYATLLMTVKCRRGYGIVDPHGDGTGTKQVYCVHGEWSQAIPKCVRFCKLDPDPSIRYMCYLPGTRIEICKTFVPPGTLVDPICNTPNYYSTEVFPTMKCISGFWNYIALCKAECGRITPGGNQLVIGGTQAKRGELPWHAGIYRKTTQPYTQICSGSLISNNVIISAAHCFWKDLRNKLPASEFGVAIGKLFRPWDSEEDIGAQKSDVKEIKIPNLFQGEAANYQEDIAVLILTTSFNYTTYIRPVCLNFNPNFDRWQLQHGKLGKVAGWGLTAANGIASETLKVVDIPFIGVETCINTLPTSFREYITSDKFCAGYTNGTSLCQGDSGGGLAFPDKELGIDRYYLRGIVSAAPNDANKLCNDHTYSTFTKITKHQDFIKDALAASVRNTCPIYSFQCADGSCADPGSDCNGRRDCEDGSDESEEYCAVGAPTVKITHPQRTTPEPEDRKMETPTVPTTQHSTSLQFALEQTTTTTTRSEIKQKPIQPYVYNNVCGDGYGNTSSDFYYDGQLHVPWLAAIYTTETATTSDVLEYLCGGTLITDKHVISVAHLFQDKLLDSIRIVFGGNLKNRSDNFPVTRSVISISGLEYLKASTFENDISVLTLNKKVELNTFIKPACLWISRAEKLVGIYGVFAGWGMHGLRSPGYSEEPHQLRMQIIRTDICNLTKFSFIKLDKFLCARDPKGGNPYSGDSGGGLYMLYKDKWTLRGIFPLFPNNLNGYILFADVIHSMHWIQKVISFGN